MENANITSEEYLNIQEPIKLREEMLSECNFEIPYYIADEILNFNNYNNLCSLINLAVINNRISVENGEYLKQKSYKVFNY